MRNLTKPELAIKLKPWLTTGILKSISKKTFYYKKYNAYFHKFKHNSKKV